MAVTNVAAGNTATINANNAQNGEVHVYFHTTGINGSISYTLGTGTGRNAPKPISIPINNGGPHKIVLGGLQLNILNLSNQNIQLLH